MKKRDNKMKFHAFVLLIPLIFLFFISFASASFGFNLNSISNSNIGTFPLGKVNIVQTCDNCTSNNITSIYYPQGNYFLIQQETIMNKSGTLYNYTYPQINQTGGYVVTGHGDDNGKDTAWVLTFSVGTKISLGIFIILLCISVLIIGFGVYYEETGIILFGAMALGFLGVFTFNNGIDVYKSTLVDGFSLFISGIALIIGLESIRKILDV